jgi:hypothetical protein
VSLLRTSTQTTSGRYLGAVRDARAPAATLRGPARRRGAAEAGQCGWRGAAALPVVPGLPSPPPAPSSCRLAAVEGPQRAGVPGASPCPPAARRTRLGVPSQRRPGRPGHTRGTPQGGESPTSPARVGSGCCCKKHQDSLPVADTHRPGKGAPCYSHIRLPARGPSQRRQGDSRSSASHRRRQFQEQATV